MARRIGVLIKRVVRAGLGGALLCSVCSCAGAVDSLKTEDNVRRMVPIPICIRPLANRAKSGVAQSLTPDDYWSIVMTSYDRESKSLTDRNAPDCAGQLVLNNSQLNEAEGPRTGPIKVTDADTVIGTGPAGFKVAWLRTHKFSDGTAAGPIALLRGKEEYAEVYAVGFYRGRPDKSRLGIERLGYDILVTATDDGCTGAKPDQTCETGLTVFLLSGGRLHPGTRVSIDRVQYVLGTEGGGGRLQYRLSATPQFDGKSFRMIEQVTVRDAAQRELRKAELERMFMRRGRTQLVANANSLWAQVMSTSGSGANATFTAPPGVANPRTRTPHGQPSTQNSQFPDISSIPQPPSMPDVPSVPSIPQPPSAPQLPSAPSLPQF